MTTFTTHHIDGRDRNVPFELVVLDMAGTTVGDDGIVERAFQRAAERTGIADAQGWDAALRYVRDTMGMSKIDVFTHLAGGDAEAAAAANAQFEGAYAELVAEEGVREIPGAADTIRQFRSDGLRVVLTTGFSPVTRDAVLDALGWFDLVDFALSPVDAGRGRPAPDMILTALMRTGTSSVRAVAVAGDTGSDIATGLNAGAGLVAGVLTGAHDFATLTAAGADHVLDDVTALSALVAERL